MAEKTKKERELADQMPNRKEAPSAAKTAGGRGRWVVEWKDGRMGGWENRDGDGAQDGAADRERRKETARNVQKAVFCRKVLEKDGH